MEKKQVIKIIDNPLDYSAEERKKAAQFVMGTLDDITLDEQGRRPYYHFIMHGDEGIEGYVVVRDEKEISEGTLRNMELRARMNGHRNISGYAFRAKTKVPPDRITPELLEKATKIF